MLSPVEEITKDTQELAFEIDGEKLSIKDSVLESGRKLSEILIPAIANAQFATFKEQLKKGEYDKVYTSAVFKSIVDMCKNQKTITLKTGTKVLRARVINEPTDIYSSKNGIHFEDDVLRGYDWYNSKEPAIGISSEGRANSRYSSYFYCANNGPTAASEIKANIGDYISLASFTIMQDLSLIRLEEKGMFEDKTINGCYQNIIAHHFSVPISDTQEYRLTQFISDEIRKYGVDGICYKSHFTNDENYVIFNCSMDTIKFNNSKIIQLHSQQLNFIDFSGCKMISTKAIPTMDKEQIQREKQYLYGMMEAYQEEMETIEDTDDNET